MNVCVTGTRGFVGRHLTAHLDRAGHTVISVARGRKPADQAGTVTHVDADLLHPVELPEPVDALVHCAAVIPARCADGDAIVEQNRRIAENISSAAITAGARRVIYMSSMAVYGNVTADVVDAETPPADPAPYGIAKQAGEEVFETACRDAGISPPVSLRLPGVVGPGSHDNFLSGAMQKIRAGEPIQARNPDGPFNNILFVDDLCAFVEHLLTFDDWPGTAMAFPLASREPLTIDAVLRAMFEGAGRDAEIDYQDPPGHAFLIDSAHAKTLGYRPQTVMHSVQAFIRSQAGA